MIVNMLYCRRQTWHEQHNQWMLNKWHNTKILRKINHKNGLIPQLKASEMWSKRKKSWMDFSRKFMDWIERWTTFVKRTSHNMGPLMFLEVWVFDSSLCPKSIKTCYLNITANFMWREKLGIIKFKSLRLEEFWWSFMYRRLIASV